MALNGKLQALAAFDDTADIGAIAQHFGSHEEGPSLQMRFAKNVLSVISVLRPRTLIIPHHFPDTASFSRFDHGPYLRGLQLQMLSSQV